MLSTLKCSYPLLPYQDYNITGYVLYAILHSYDYFKI